MKPENLPDPSPIPLFLYYLFTPTDSINQSIRDSDNTVVIQAETDGQLCFKNYHSRMLKRVSLNLTTFPLYIVCVTDHDSWFPAGSPLLWRKKQPLFSVLCFLQDALTMFLKLQLLYSKGRFIQ